MGTVQEEGGQGPLVGTAKVRSRATFLPQGRDLEGHREAEAMMTTVPG